MAALTDTARDGLLTFLPHRLNRQPVVVRSLTADELWICARLFPAAGFVAGIPMAGAKHSIAMVPTVVVAGVAAGVFGDGGSCTDRSVAALTLGCIGSCSGI
jgi:conjugative transfer region protein (TIGR03750 family)